MNQRKSSVIAGWVLTILLAAFLSFSASGKFTQWEGKQEMFEKLGWQESVMQTVGIVELVIVGLVLIPQTAFLGTILLTAYLGGAVATHVRIDDPFFFPIIIGVVAWIALGLRFPTVFDLTLGRGSAAQSNKQSDT